MIFVLTLPVERMFVYNKNISIKAFSEIYQRGEEHLKSLHQWKKLELWDYVHHYAVKLEAIVELLEEFMVFHHGDGLDAFKNYHQKKKTVEERFLSFKEVIEISSSKEVRK